MRKWLTVVLLLAGCQATPPADTTLGFYVQSEAAPILKLPCPDNDDFVNAAQELADQRGEAVVVCQGPQFICVVNPKDKP